MGQLPLCAPLLFWFTFHHRFGYYKMTSFNRGHSQNHGRNAKMQLQICDKQSADTAGSCQLSIPVARKDWPWAVFRLERSTALSGPPLSCKAVFGKTMGRMLKWAWADRKHSRNLQTVDSKCLGNWAVCRLERTTALQKSGHEQNHRRNAKMQLEQVGSTGLAFARNRSFCHGNACGNTKKQKNTHKKKKQHKTQKNPMLRHTMTDTCQVCIVCIKIVFFVCVWFFCFLGFPMHFQYKMGDVVKMIIFPLQNEWFRENDYISNSKSVISWKWLHFHYKMTDFLKMIVS